MQNGDIALYVSGGSAILSLAGFVWNIWEKFIYIRPRVQVTFGVYRILDGGRTNKQLCSINVTNMGPGPVILRSCIMKPPRQLLRQRKFGILNPIHGDPMSDNPASIGPFSGGLPAKIEAGEVKAFYFPFARKTFLAEPMGRIGVDDTYGRLHWCKRKDVRKAKRMFAEEFPGASRAEQQS